MAYYTNSNQIREVMTCIADVTVKTLENAPKEWSDLTLYIFDNLFRDRALITYRVGREDDAMTFRALWQKRPEWGGMILEMMKESYTVHLCVDEDEWYRVCFYPYGQGEDFFKFIRENPPVMNASQNCLISTEEHLSKEMDDAIVELMEPMRVGQSMMRRLFYKSADRTNKKAKFTGCDYRELCCKLETLINDVKHQRDLWKDRFFFRAIAADEDELCEECKEGMRQAFYDNCDEFDGDLDSVEYVNITAINQLKNWRTLKNEFFY